MSHKNFFICRSFNTVQYKFENNKANYDLLESIYFLKNILHFVIYYYIIIIVINK